VKSLFIQGNIPLDLADEFLTFGSTGQQHSFSSEQHFFNTTNRRSLWQGFSHEPFLPVTCPVGLTLPGAPPYKNFSLMTLK
jgi:hypothetical protein